MQGSKVHSSCCHPYPRPEFRRRGRPLCQEHIHHILFFRNPPLFRIWSFHGENSMVHRARRQNHEVLIQYIRGDDAAAHPPHSKLRSGSKDAVTVAHHCHCTPWATRAPPGSFWDGNLLKSAKEVNLRLRAQATVQQDIPAALVRLVQIEFNKSFRQVFDIHLLVCWTHFTPLIPTLTTGNFHLGTVTMHGELWSNIPRKPLLPRVVLTPSPHHTQKLKCNKGGVITMPLHQVAVNNTTPLPHLQFCLGFRLQKSMEKSTETTREPFSLKDDGLQFLISYHLKGVWSLNCSGRHNHRKLYFNDQGILSAWKSIIIHHAIFSHRSISPAMGVRRGISG